MPPFPYGYVRQGGEIVVPSNLSQELVAGEYELQFQFNKLVSLPDAEKSFPRARVRAELQSRFAREMASWEYKNHFFEGAGDGRNVQGITVQVNVTGTPLLALVSPLVAVVLILSAGAVIIYLSKVVVVKLAQDIGGAIEKVGGGVEEVGKGLGAGLKFGLPLVGLGAGVLLAIIGIQAARQ